MQQLVKSILLVFVFGFFCKISICQLNSNFPYQGGEKKMKIDFIDYVSNKIPMNDSTSIFFIEVTYSSINKAPEFKINGTGNENDSLNKVVKAFFYASSYKWDTQFLQKTRIIIPVFMTTYCRLDKNGDVDWAIFNTKNMPMTNIALFLSPIIVTFYCSEKCSGT